jgi:predicted SAM-dependent methyltransferase
MHLSSFEGMRKFIERHLNTPGRIADVGSLDINGSYRSLFNDPWEYTGIDIVKGKNVDIAVKERYNWKEIKDNSFDVVISGQTLEHVDKDEDVIQEMHRILKPKGLCCIIVPSAGPHHEKHDYRRYTNEGLNNVMVSNGFSIIESYMNESMHWRDVVVIARKT